MVKNKTKEEFRKKIEERFGRLTEKDQEEIFHRKALISWYEDLIEDAEARIEDMKARIEKLEEELKEIEDWR